jgi:hypothetical protein
MGTNSTGRWGHSSFVQLISLHYRSTINHKLNQLFVCWFTSPIFSCYQYSAVISCRSRPPLDRSISLMLERFLYALGYDDQLFVPPETIADRPWTWLACHRLRPIILSTQPLQYVMTLFAHSMRDNIQDSADIAHSLTTLTTCNGVLKGFGWTICIKLQSPSRLEPLPYRRFLHMSDCWERYASSRSRLASSISNCPFTLYVVQAHRWIPDHILFHYRCRLGLTGDFVSWTPLSLWPWASAEHIVAVG